MNDGPKERYRPGLRNDGMRGFDYEVIPGEDAFNRQVSWIVNEAWHVHRHHPGGWKRFDNAKDDYARDLDALLAGDTAREAACLALKDRVLSMLIYRARELRKNAQR